MAEGTQIARDVPGRKEEVALSASVATQRAQHAFDIAASRTAEGFGKANAPPPSELAGLSSMISEARRTAGPGGRANAGDILDDYVAKNPDSRIARLNALAGGSTEWIISGSGKAVFSQWAFTAAFKQTLSGVKSGAVSLMTEISSNQEKDSGEIPLPKTLAPPVAQLFVSELDRQINGKGAKDPLPLDVKYANGAIECTSRLKGGTERVVF